MFVKKALLRNVADILLGFAILMVGMQNMSAAVAPLKQSEDFTSMFTMFNNPVLGILLGIGFAVVLQSASAAIGVLQALSVTGGITFAAAFPITMGIGVGASSPVLLSAIGAGKNGKRTALVYLIIDLFGMIACSVLFYGIHAFRPFDFMDRIMSPVSIAVVNSLFRIVMMVLLFPFIKHIEKLLFRLIPSAEDDESETEDFELLEERFLDNPPLAIEQSQIALGGMIRQVKSNLKSALRLLDDFSEEAFRKVDKKEKLIDRYEDKLEAYLVQLPVKEMEPQESRKVSKILYMVGEFERLADQAVNIADVASDLYERKATFSEEAREELSVLNGAVKEIVELTVDVFRREDMDMAAEVSSLKETVSALCNEYKLAHIERIQCGKCNKQSEFIFHELLDEMEHVAVYCTNVTVTMVELNKQEVQEISK